MMFGMTCTTLTFSLILQCVNIFLVSIGLYFFALCIDMNNGE
jgi:hypothetical protein